MTALAVSVLTPQAQARSYTIETGEFRVKRLGSLNLTPMRRYVPDIAKATRAFGTPSNAFQRNRGCIVKWDRLGLRIEFWNYGVHAGGICHPQAGIAQSFTIERSRKWRTSKGLRIGMPEERVWDLHPSASWAQDLEYSPNGFWLREAISPFGDNSPYAVLAAYLSNGDTGRVKSFAGWVGAAGE